jgi:protein O-GlcNAc transferase
LGKRSRELRLRRAAAAQAGVSQPPNAIKLQQARALHSQGQLARAEALYQQLLEENPEHAEALHLMGVISLQQGRPDTAVTLISRALSIDSRNSQAHANLGSAFFVLQRWEEALAHYDKAQELNPGFVGVHHNRGTALQSLGRHAEAAVSFKRLLDSMPDAEFVLGNLVYSLGYACDWTDIDRYTQRLVEGVRTGRRSARPFGFLSVSASAADQLQCARTYPGSAGLSSTAPWSAGRYQHDRIRIAYVSADFRDHVVSHMMAPIYELHDTTQFHVVGVSIAGSDDSEVVARSKRALGQFIDAAGTSDEDVARILRELEIDIAVDLTGYTLGSRPGIFARRPAPIHVSYLGFPATMGVPYMDYILADDFVIPRASQDYYTERVVYLPGTFQGNDERRSRLDSQLPPTRRAAGLPDSGLVYCCFNNNYKLNPPLFDVWARVLNSSGDSVLWLLASEPAVETHLRQEAVKRGIQAERLVFAARVPYEQHLARLSLADLYLDTLPFNGGASASDALWMGVPVLTCSGEAFAARMAGSLLRAIGMPELITHCLEEYERQALQLDSQQLSQYKARLLARGTGAALFDGQRFCRHLESAYRNMWERSQRGEAPASFCVEPLPVPVSPLLSP